MGIVKTIGGDRLGSGRKMKTSLHNYERSTHDLSYVWRSTMTPGTLVPFMKKVCLRGDTWSINLREMLRTMPSVGPLFGTYKLQLDLFAAPIRLYNGVLHNNYVNIGTRMNEVYFPKITLAAMWKNPDYYVINEFDTCQVSSSSLIAYLGIRGIGSISNMADGTNYGIIQRDFNATPMLAYWDIFKNYYANKQEANAYVIRGKEEWETPWLKFTANVLGSEETNWNDMNPTTIWYNANVYTNEFPAAGIGGSITAKMTGIVPIPIINEQKIIVKTNVKGLTNELANVNFGFYNKTNGTEVWKNGDDVQNDLGIELNLRTDVNTGSLIIEVVHVNGQSNYNLIGLNWMGEANKSEIILQKFPLQNIDKMREEIYKDTGLGNEFKINLVNVANGMYPYLAMHEVNNNGECMSKYPLVGLALKTYQSDILNNWLSSEYIDGLNGIAAVTAVDTSNGLFTMDALNLAEKVYNMLNRIIVAGNTYEDWQEAVWGEKGRLNHETPIYLGGASATIAFEEVISTADTTTTEAGNQPLGTLAGKGVMTNEHGGHIEYHCDEASYIMGIVSITPYIDYMQGNDFDMTEFDSVNDLHKPALDGIGFQNLLLERAAWWGTQWNNATQTWVRHTGGKLPAWVEYMTATNQIYGDFAKSTINLGFMCLGRRYEFGTSVQGNRYLPIKDWTTYINPTKYNYQFANNALDAQNFWVQIGIDCIVRRKMSAKIIPNL